MTASFVGAYVTLFNIERTSGAGILNGGLSVTVFRSCSKTRSNSSKSISNRRSQSERKRDTVFPSLHTQRFVNA
jgi:hypothetical protein